MKDKTPIAKTDKSAVIFILIISLMSFPCLFFCLNLLRLSSLRWIGIFFISGIIFLILLAGSMLVLLPKYAVVKEGERVIVYRGVFKDIFPCFDIVKVQLAPLEKGEKEKKNGGIILTVKTENGAEEDLHVSVQDKEQVVERIKEIMESFSAFSKTEPVNMQNIEQSE